MFSREPHGFRHLCDATAVGAAKYLRRIERFEESLLDLFEQKVRERVRIEKGFCEFLLAERKKVHHRDVDHWKQIVAESLSLEMGRRVGKAVIEERLTRAYAAEEDPNYWDKLVAACLMSRSLDFRRSMGRLLKPAEEPDTSSDGDDDEDGEESTEETGGAQSHHDLGHVAADVLDALGIDDSEDPVAVARDLRAEVERLRTENDRLRAEVTRLGGEV